MENKRRRLTVDYDLKYVDNVNLYTDVPEYVISLHELERLATERLKVLLLIEEQTEAFRNKRYTNQHFVTIKSKITDLPTASSFPTYNFMFTGDEDERTLARKNDHISHFLLRLAVAGSYEHRNWFIRLETDLLQFRLWESRNRSSAVLEKMNVKFEEISCEDKCSLWRQIEAASVFGHADPGTVNVYKIPFVHALPLVRLRKAYISKGYAYVVDNDLWLVIKEKYTHFLSESLAMLRQRVHEIIADERLEHFVVGFLKQRLPNVPVLKKGGCVTAAEVHSLSDRFPLCMRTCYNSLRSNKHLKHGGRLQLGLFLKGVGMPLDEAVSFWRTNFNNINTFDKQYLYGIRHLYGMEGKRADYTPHSCSKIINAFVTRGDCHGCPFKNFSATALQTEFTKMGLSRLSIIQLMKLVDKRDFQTACRRLYELQTSKKLSGKINHPNQYFLQSEKKATKKTMFITPPVTLDSRTVKPDYQPEINQQNQPDQAIDNFDEATDQVMAVVDLNEWV